MYFPIPALQVRVLNLAEPHQKWSVATDAYHGVLRLNLYEWDGTPVNPMYIAYNPPVMLPTQTMNPTAAASTATAAAKAKRGVFGSNPMNQEKLRTPRSDRNWIDAGTIWWIGVGMTVVGGTAYLL